MCKQPLPISQSACCILSMMPVFKIQTNLMKSSAKVTNTKHTLQLMKKVKNVPLLKTKRQIHKHKLVPVLKLWAYTLSVVTSHLYLVLASVNSQPSSAFVSHTFYMQSRTVAFWH